MTGVNRQRLVAEFLGLVKINSPSLEEGQIVQFITKKLKTLGFQPQEDNCGSKINGQAGNIYVFVPGNLKNKPAIFLNAHLDTVKPGRNIRPLVKGDVIKSAGDNILGADDKAGVAVILEVLRILKEKKIRRGDLEIIFTVAEEIGLKGAKNFNSRRIKSKFGYVLDGSRYLHKLITASPTQITFEAEFSGRAAHAGIDPEKGINAIQMAAKAVSLIKTGRIDSETTANIGVIEGGVATNIVPEKVMIKGEVRSHRPSKLNKKIKEIKNIFAAGAKKMGGRLKWQAVTEYFSYNLNKKSRPVEVFSQAARSLGSRPVCARSGGGSDANVFNQAGIPTAVLPAGMEEPHSAKEKIRISRLVKVVQLVLQIIKTVARGD